MKKLPIGLQTFSKIIEGGYVYVDKTQYVYDLINSANYYFLSRPRRFGKSLLLDTVAEAFKGNKELFKGLWIYDSDYDFEEHPVIRLDMSSVATEKPEILKNSILSSLRHQIREEGLAIDEEAPSDMFKRLIEGLCKKYGKKVVVLIDEYDKPVIDHLHNVEMAEANRLVIKGFYGILKSSDPYLRFTFLTGVSKFTKTSVFSELNNLKDITMMEQYASVCGISEQELDKYFSEHIDSFKKPVWFSENDCLREKILKWYNGYSWDSINKVINPFSLLTFFGQQRFGSFWYASGSPKFLIDLIKKNPGEYTNIRNPVISEFQLDAADFNRLEATPLLFQTGYLTVKEIAYRRELPVYVLEIPNNEVREAFGKNIIAAFTESGHSGAENAQWEISGALDSGDMQLMLAELRRLFASIPYNLHVDAEAYYHSIFYAVMSVLGYNIMPEASVSSGRIDAVLELKDKIYVMEFKYKGSHNDASAEEKAALFNKALTDGMEQINSKGYHRKYIGSGKMIYKAAFAFLGRDDIEMRVETVD